MINQVLYIFKNQKRKLAILFIVILLGTIVELLGISLIAPVTTIIANESVISTNTLYALIGQTFDLKTAGDYVVFFSIMLITVYIFKNLYIMLEYNLQYRFVYNSQRKLMVRMLRCYMNEDYLFHVSHNVADLQRNILTDVDTTFQAIQGILQLLTEACVCVAIVVYLMITDITSTVGITVILGVFLLTFAIFYKRNSAKIGNENRAASSTQTKWIYQSFAGIKEIKTSNREEFFIYNFDKAASKYAETKRKQMIFQVIPRPIMETVTICGLLAIMAVRIYGGAELISFVPILSVFVIAAFRMLPSFNRMASCFNTIMFAKAAINNVYTDIKDIEGREVNGVDILDSSEDNRSFNHRGNIKIEHVSFHYPEAPDCVLLDVSLEIIRNRSTALIGPSGAGKSTFADILLGVLRPQSGNVSVGGVSIFSNLDSWHKVIGYIPQMIYLMDDSIRSNVAFGIPEKDVDDQKIWTALKDAQLEDFVNGLPEKLDTQVGDRGVRLSGGQRQRIGIARALYNKADILVFDEATSSLDSETEEAVMKAIDNLHGNRTLIIIAHRLTTIKNCDYVYQVDKQNVVEIEKRTIEYEN